MNRSFTLSHISVLCVILVFFSVKTSQGQESEYTEEKIEAFKADVQNLVNFLEYSFNTLGNPETSARDKDVIINQSYAKIFMDEEVQIEDDLDDEREILINKDVQAYLKDIDFFFKEAEFSLNVTSIDHSFKSDGEIFFTVSLTRTLNARTVLGDTISSNKERFIEVNYDDVAQDLRIASIYTTRIDERDELFAWWNKMSPEWRKMLGADAFIKDTIPFSTVVEINDTLAIIEYPGIQEIPIDTFLAYDEDTLFINETEIIEGMIRDTIAPPKNYSYRMLQRIAAEPEIDISGNLTIYNLDPLAQMSNIIKVNCANTLIDELSPLRSLIKLETVECAGTAVTDLAPLQYSVSLKSLDIHATRIADIHPLENLRNLEKLYLSNTPVDSIDMLRNLKKLSDLRINNTVITDVSALQKLKNLRIVNISGTNVTDLSPLSELEQLERLYISNTGVDDLTPLSTLKRLQTIYLDSTRVYSLDPLDKLPNLEQVYCDNTGINSTKAEDFMAANPKVLVIYESVALARWWENMSAEWRSIFMEITGLGPSPGKEELHQAVKITEIDISGNELIKSLAPLEKLSRLNRLNCSNTAIRELDPLADLIDLQYLDCSETQVSDCSGLRDLMNLEYLNLSNTSISNIVCISRINGLKELDIAETGVSTLNVFDESRLDLVYADNTPLSLEEVKQFKKINPDCIIVYQTDELNQWWNNLNVSWHEILSGAIGIKEHPGPTELQRIADLQLVDLGQSTSLGNLQPLKKLYRLQELRMSGTQISDLEPIADMETIEVLVISNNPIEELSQISGLSRLRYLEFKNTSVDDLEPLAGLIQLEILDMAGTQVKKLDELVTLNKLRQLSCYNTRVRSLSPLEGLSSLELVKCYNTRLNDRRVDRFKEARPDCEVVFY